MENKYPNVLRLIESGKLSNDDLVRLLKIEKYDEYNAIIIKKINWHNTLAIPKLYKKISSFYYHESETTDLVESLISQNFSNEEIVKFIFNAELYVNSRSLFEIIAATSSFSELLKYAVILNNNYFWSSVAKRDEINDLDKETLLALEKNFRKLKKRKRFKGTFTGWHALVITGKLDIIDMQRAYKEWQSSELRDAIISVIEKSNYSGDELIDFFNILLAYSQRSQHDTYWILNAIIKKKVVNEELMFQITATVNPWSQTWETLFRCSEKTLDEILTLIKSISGNWIKAGLIASTRMPLPMAYAMALKVNYSDCYAELFKHYTLSLEQYLALLNGDKDIQFYYWAESVPLKNLDLKQIISISRKYKDYPPLLGRLLEEETLSTEDMIKAGFLLDNDYWWGVINEKMSLTV
jgi:hypothetical protein